MSLSAPNFWQQKSILSYLLIPFSWAYMLAGFIRKKLTKQTKLNIPIICVGNIVAGGAGKTPTAIALARLLQGKYKVAFISKGYGGNNKSVLKVDSKKHPAALTGDEPLLLAQHAPTYICPNRALAAQAAQNNGAELIIMDDGMQNPSLHKDITIMVVDANYGLGNGSVIPAGPLRQTVTSGINQADIILVIGNKLPSQLTDAKNKVIYAKPVIKFDKKLLNKKLLAFCGLGNPNKFFNSLKDDGLNIAKTIPYPDHYKYTEQDITKLNNFITDGYTLITTTKDAVKLGNKLDYNIIELDLQIEGKIIGFVEKTLS